MDPTLLTVVAAVLGFVVVAGLGLGLAGQGSGPSARTLKRTQTIAGGREARDGARRRPAANAQDQRRRQVLKNLRDQDKQQKRALLSIGAKLQQAGLGTSARGFWIASGVVAVVVLLILLVLRQNPLIAFGLAFAAGFGLPRWVLNTMAAMRIKKFTGAFPDATDIIVRGIKSGLPVHDCLRVIAQETSDPLAGEFRLLVESVGMGVPMDQGLEKMFERMPTPEVRFFSIVLAIQAKTGGNLAEALAGLSNVIRARKLMREKVKALSGEAVASAFIIGSLPPGVVTLITLTSPSYMAPMFADPRGHIMLMAGGFWMAIGIFVMRKMINFKI
jgi:tight adherence protein B